MPATYALHSHERHKHGDPKPDPTQVVVGGYRVRVDCGQNCGHAVVERKPRESNSGYAARLRAVADTLLRKHF